MSHVSGSKVTRQRWGRTSQGEDVDLFTLASDYMTVRVTTFGARVVSTLAPDKNGAYADIVLGYDDVLQYEADRKTYFGATIGRFANRIAGGAFSLDGKKYEVPINNPPNALHGGPEGFDRKLWSAQEIPDGVKMSLTSPDGDMGFPGALTVHVAFTLHGQELHIKYNATTTETTVVNLTNHTYFNLAGATSGSNILGHELTINAERFNPIDGNLIPEGPPLPVAGTPFDFRTETAIGERIGDGAEQLDRAGGYDHNFVLNAYDSSVAAAVVYEPRTGRTLSVFTTEPGVQFYSGNFLDGTNVGKAGVVYARRSGLCLETQHFPDSPNRPNFPCTELQPAETFASQTKYVFATR